MYSEFFLGRCGLQGSNNIVGKSGDHTLCSEIYISLISSSGPAEAIVTGPYVVVKIKTSPSLAKLLYTYNVMAKDGASVTMGDPVRKSPLAALANRTLTADDGTFNLTAAHENVVTSALAALSIIFDNSGGKLILGLGKDGSDTITFKSRTGYDNAHAVIEVEGATAVVSVKNFLSNTLVAMDNEISIVIIGFFLIT